MPLLSPSPPCPIWVSPDFSKLVPVSEIIQDVPRALHAIIEAYKATSEPLEYALPAIALSVLFFSSTLYTEAITQSKYDAYKAYKERVGMFGFIGTWEKGILLTLKGRRAEVEAAIWGSEKKNGKEE
jgi:hypothetical protein